MPFECANMEKNQIQALIDRHLKFYQTLNDGSRKPDTAAQVHFVKVCRGALLPETDHERAYMAYRQSKAKQEYNTEEPAIRSKPTVGQKPRPAYKKPPLRTFAQPQPNRSQAAGTKPVSQPNWKRFIDEPLGTRDDFRKDSAGNKNRARYPK